MNVQKKILERRELVFCPTNGAWDGIEGSRMKLIDDGDDPYATWSNVS
jgi:hypothetical protein